MKIYKSTKFGEKTKFGVLAIFHPNLVKCAKEQTWWENKILEWKTFLNGNIGEGLCTWQVCEWGRTFYIKHTNGWI